MSLRSLLKYAFDASANPLIANDPRCPRSPSWHRTRKSAACVNFCSSSSEISISVSLRLTVLSSGVRKNPRDSCMRQRRSALVKASGGSMPIAPVTSAHHCSERCERSSPRCARRTAGPRWPAPHAPSPGECRCTSPASRFERCSGVEKSRHQLRLQFVGRKLVALAGDVSHLPVLDR